MKRITWKKKHLQWYGVKLLYSSVTLGKELIQIYTGEKNATIPYCDECDSRLLTFNKMKDQIEQMG